VPDQVIAEIRQREVHGLIELPKRPAFRRGDQVRVLREPLAGRLAIFAGMKPRKRVEVLLAFLGSEQWVILPEGCDRGARRPRLEGRSPPQRRAPIG